MSKLDYTFDHDGVELINRFTVLIARMNVNITSFHVILVLIIYG